MKRIPVRKMASGRTHLADVPDNYPCFVMRSFGVDFLSPEGPISTLCMVTLDGVLVHMRDTGSAKTSPKACPTCARLNLREPREILGALPAAEVLAEIERRGG